MLIAIGALIALVLLVATFLVTRPRRVRFTFEDREDYVVLEIRNRVESNDSALITMTALREAVRLKMLRDYRRLLVDVHRLAVANDASFWLLIGGLGPLLLTASMRTALVSAPRSDIGKRLRDAAIGECFATEAEALSFLRSTDPVRDLGLDREWVESLLLPRNRLARPLRRAA